MFAQTSKMEINLLHNTGRVDFGGNQLSTFVIKNKVPAVVCVPELVEIVAVDRSQFSHRYKIICAVDFNNGRNYGLAKVRDLPQSCLMADGFEVRLTAGRSDKETLNEMRGITNFFRQIHSTKEIRWALSLRSTSIDQFVNCLKHAKSWPGSFIRTDIDVDSPIANMETHVRDFAAIRKYIHLPIKVSGSVDYDTIVALSGDIARFDVSMDQARSIIRSYNIRSRKTPSEVEEIVEEEVEIER
jgi:hypothetical protein